MQGLVIIIPVYQHGRELGETLSKLAETNFPIIAVNDGSDEFQSQLIEEACLLDHVTLIRREKNGGKGTAVIDALTEAKRSGYTHAFQIDADGQHDLSSVAHFVAAAENNIDHLILGKPQYDNSAPLRRKIPRYLTHIWVWINTLSFSIRDSMCGFRIYPINKSLEVIQSSAIGRHMDFDTEICVRASWAGVKVLNLPVKVIYPTHGKSNFRAKEDNILITWMHTKLFFGMLVRLPILILRKLKS